jgi:hypothetical protein
MLWPLSGAVLIDSLETEASDIALATTSPDVPYLYLLKAEMHESNLVA